jgi:hypothetical protein
MKARSTDTEPLTNEKAEIFFIPSLTLRLQKRIVRASPLNMSMSMVRLLPIPCPAVHPFLQVPPAFATASLAVMLHLAMEEFAPVCPYAYASQ